MQGNVVHLGRSAALAAAAFALSVPSAMADGGKGGPPATPPGQQKAADAPAPPAHAPAHGVRGTSPQPSGSERSAKSSPPAHAPAHGHRARAGAPAAKKAKRPKAPRTARPAKGDGKSGPARSTQPPASRGRSTDAPKGGRAKVTICHATGSATNPFVEITVAEPAVRAHSRHHDGADIVPAPAGGCPKAAPTDAAVQAAGARVEQALATPAATPNPAPATTTVASRQAAEETPGGTFETSAQIGTVGTRGGDEVAVLGESATAGEVPDDGEQAVAGETAVVAQAASRDDAEPTPAAQLADSESDGSLPFTGMDVAFLLIAAAAALITGFALRRASRARPTR